MYTIVINIAPEIFVEGYFNDLLIGKSQHRPSSDEKKIMYSVYFLGKTCIFIRQMCVCSHAYIYVDYNIMRDRGAIFLFS